MKKLILIGVGFLLAMTVIGVGGYAFAQALPDNLAQDQNQIESQTTTNPTPPGSRERLPVEPYGCWMVDQVNSSTDEMFCFIQDENGPGLLHDYLWPEIAKAFNLTEEQVEAFEIVRATIQDIREDLTKEEIREIMTQAMTASIENALADGTITEEQAEEWFERIEKMDIAAQGESIGMRVRSGSFRQGFKWGVKMRRQMMVNQEYLDASIADALGISNDEVQELKSDQGLNLKTFPETQDLSEDEFAALRKEILTNAVNAALEDGAISEKQAEWILEQIENNQGRGVWLYQP